MANLKGGDLDRQIRDANHRLAAFGVRHHGTDSHKTHSDALRIKREGYLRQFKEYLETKGLSEEKLNVSMNEKELSDFFDQRLEGLAFSTQEDILRGWSGLLQGLEQANVSISVGTGFFDEKVAHYKAEAIDNGERLGMPKQVISSHTPTYVIDHLPFASSCLAQLQYETGYRVSEAYAVLEGLERHLHDTTITAVSGKGGQLYQDKEISIELKSKLSTLVQEHKPLPHQSTYYRHLQRFDMRSHDLRAHYAKELYDRVLEELRTKEPQKGDDSTPESRAFSIVSKELNHHRIEITQYYLDKFGGKG